MAIIALNDSDIINLHREILTMGILKNEFEETKIENNGEFLDEAASEIDVPISCGDGNCSSCVCEIISGGEFLSPKTEAEIEFMLEDNERMLCQCKFIGGDDDVVEVDQ